jgi:uracil-DNA glycosylase
MQLSDIPESWRPHLGDEVEKPYFRSLAAYLDEERRSGHTILPAREDVFHALRAAPYENVRVLLLGQDPYPTPGHAHGLCFSVRPGVRPLPGSLRNIYKELYADVGATPPGHGFLDAWARQGILMLNTVLTVRAGEANSHQKRGWETFTDRILEVLNAKPARVVFVLWGRQAQMKRALIAAPQHRVVEAAHPSPLSARFFLGSRCFSAVNAHLVDAALPPIMWQLPPLAEGVEMSGELPLR